MMFEYVPISTFGKWLKAERMNGPNEVTRNGRLDEE